MQSKLMRLLPLVALLCALFVGVHLATIQAAMVCNWCHAPVTQTYSKTAPEHGVDLYTRGEVITARLEGTVTFDAREPWDGTGVQDITWRLTHPWLAKNFRYMYVQIKAGSSFVHVGEFINAGTALGYSGYFIEFGLSNSWAYGVHGDWSADWTTDPRFLL